MDPAQFEVTLRTEGFEEIETKSVSPRKDDDAHAHPFDVKALVLDGTIALETEEGLRTYRGGDVFTMPRGCPHREEVGPEGVRILVGRRHDRSG